MPRRWRYYGESYGKNGDDCRIKKGLNIITNDPNTQIIKDQYRTSGNLEARIRLHQLFSTNPYGWYRWYVDHLQLEGNARVLELGCGAGSLWTRQLDRLPANVQLTLSDYSAGMAQQARKNLPDARFTFLVADAQTIPFANEYFDAVIANHMLYHVPDRDRALSEIRRVLRPGGKLYAATNGDRHLTGLDGLVERLAPQLMHRLFAPNFAAGFTLQNGGEQIARHFEQMTLDCYPDGLNVTQTGPLVDYVLSMLGATNQPIPEEDVSRFTQLVEEEIQAKGAIYITKEAGVFIAS